MWSVIVTQLLTLALALLGALLGVIFGTWYIPGQRLDARVWQAVVALSLVVAFLVFTLIAEARSIERQIKLVGWRIRQEIDRAATIEYNSRDGVYHTNVELEAAIEDWRTRVNGYLTRALPGSGADIRFRTGIGEVGPAHAYEHTRLKDLKQNLLAVLDMLPSYVQRSR
jgi:prepilin signal peptidase PulO-like enzyme (type II secretory pathway)